MFSILIFVAVFIQIVLGVLLISTDYIITSDYDYALLDQCKNKQNINPTFIRIDNPTGSTGMATSVISVTHPSSLYLNIKELCNVITGSCSVVETSGRRSFMIAIGVVLWASSILLVYTYYTQGEDRAKLALVISTLLVMGIFVPVSYTEDLKIRFVILTLLTASYAPIIFLNVS